MKTLALIPAAGKSVRMGQPKLALPLGGRTVLERVLVALQDAAIRDILVVLGPHVAFLRPLAEAAGGQVLLLAEETADMRATVERGLVEMEQRFHPNADDRWLLLPADHPTMNPSVLQTLLEADQANPQSSIFIPTYEGKRGHPALIGWQHVAGIRALSVGLGLNHYLRQNAQETREVPVDSEDILLDLDTPADYELLQSRFICLP